MKIEKGRRKLPKSWIRNFFIPFIHFIIQITQYQDLPKSTLEETQKFYPPILQSPSTYLPHTLLFQTILVPDFSIVSTSIAVRLRNLGSTPDAVAGDSPNSLPVVAIQSQGIILVVRMKEVLGPLKTKLIILAMPRRSGSKRNQTQPNILKNLIPSAVVKIRDVEAEALISRAKSG